MQGYRIITPGDSSKNCLQDVVIPSGLESFAPDRTLFHGSVLLENRKCEPPKNRRDLRSISETNAAAVFAERHVQRPVQRVLDTLVAAEMLGNPLHTSWQAGDEEHGLVRLALGRFSHPIDHANRGEIRPRQRFAKRRGAGMTKYSRRSVRP